MRFCLHFKWNPMIFLKKLLCVFQSTAFLHSLQTYLYFCWNVEFIALYIELFVLAPFCYFYLSILSWLKKYAFDVCSMHKVLFLCKILKKKCIPSKVSQYSEVFLTLQSLSVWVWTKWPRMCDYIHEFVELFHVRGFVFYFSANITAIVT